MVGAEELSAEGLVGSIKSKIKILGDGELTKRLEITAHKFSKNAEQKIVASGGTVKVI
jgi:large subunit ribosomal protein L15